MKIIGITQREELKNSFGEIRNSLDKRWFYLLELLDFTPVPLPQVSIKSSSKLIDSLNLSGLILSGGNSLYECATEDCSIDRDLFEISLIKHCIKKEVPILGVCRGMQLINKFFQGKLNKVEGHVDTYHKIFFDPYYSDYCSTSVNSFHNFAINKKGLGKDLSAIATDIDGNIEALSHKHHCIYGIMWHPERESPASAKDINLFKKIFA